jgi:hypothetical protein
MTGSHISVKALKPIRHHFFPSTFVLGANDFRQGSGWRHQLPQPGGDVFVSVDICQTSPDTGRHALMAE